jgi:hypothetical protein
MLVHRQDFPDRGSQTFIVHLVKKVCVNVTLVAPWRPHDDHHEIIIELASTLFSRYIPIGTLVDVWKLHKGYRRKVSFGKFKQHSDYYNDNHYKLIMNISAGINQSDNLLTHFTKSLFVPNKVLTPIILKSLSSQFNGLYAQIV